VTEYLAGSKKALIVSGIHAFVVSSIRQLTVASLGMGLRERRRYGVWRPIGDPIIKCDLDPIAHHVGGAHARTDASSGERRRSGSVRAR